MIDGRKLPFFRDPELDYSEEEREQLRKMWKMCEPISDKKIGTIMVYGTGGDLTNNKGLEDIFYQPEKYGIQSSNNNL